jgi:hypothetical protein
MSRPCAIYVGTLAIAVVFGPARLAAQDAATLPVPPAPVAVYPRHTGDAVAGSTASPLDFSEAYASPLLRSIVETRGTQLQSSFSMSSGYDTAVDDVPNLGGAFVLAEGSLGFLVRERRSTLFIAHDAKLTYSFIHGLGLEQYQQTSASFRHEVSRRTNWSAVLENNFGSDSAHTLGSLSGSHLSSGVVDTTSNATGLATGNTLTSLGSFGLEHSTSATRTYEVDAGAYYHHYFDLGMSSFQEHADASVRETLSARTTAGVRLSAVGTTFDNAQCTTAALALFASIKLEQNLRLEASGGPAFSSDGCSGSYQYDIQLSRGTSHGMVAYLGSSRRRSDGLAPGSTWETVNFGGISVGTARRVQVRVDAGYANYQVVQATPATPLQNGYFISGEVHHRVSDTAEFSLTGRFFSRDTTTANFNRGVVLATYTWSREQHPNRLQNLGRRYDYR